MSYWTRAELIELISLWKEAYKSVIRGKSYTIAGRSLTYQDLATIKAELGHLQAELDASEGKPAGLRYFRAGMAR